MTLLSETFHNGGFIVSEASKTRSRDVGVVAAGQKLGAGTVLGKITVGAATSAALGANVGNGTFGTITVGAPAVPGAYAVEFDDATHFVVSSPSGAEVGHGVTGAAFVAGGLGFTITAGGTAFAAGDSFNVTIAAGSGKYVAFDPTLGDGSEVAVAILYADCDASATGTNADTRTTIVVRSCEVNGSELVWGANVTTTPQKNAAIATLASAGVILR